MPRSNNTRIVTRKSNRSSGGRQPGSFVVNRSRKPVKGPEFSPENANADQTAQIVPAASDVTKLALLRVALIAAALLE